MMTNFSKLIRTQLPRQEVDDRTVLIQNIPETKRKARKLKHFIERQFDGVEVTRVTFAYNVENLYQLQKQLIKFNAAVLYCQNYERKHGHPLVINPYIFNWLFLYFDQPNAIQYYQRKQKLYAKLIADEVCKAINGPKHAAFVQLKNDLMVKR